MATYIVIAGNAMKRYYLKCSDGIKEYNNNRLKLLGYGGIFGCLSCEMGPEALEIA